MSLFTSLVRSFIDPTPSVSPHAYHSSLTESLIDSDTDTDNDAEMKMSELVFPSSPSMRQRFVAAPVVMQRSQSLPLPLPPSDSFGSIDSEASTVIIVDNLTTSAGVNVSVSRDYSEILSMGYTQRQASFAVQLFNGDIHNALGYLIDMDEHPDMLESQIIQMEVESERRRMMDEEKSNDNSAVKGVWQRLMPRLSSLSRTISAAFSPSASPVFVSSAQSTIKRSVSSPSTMTPQSQSISSTSSSSLSLSYSMVNYNDSNETPSPNIDDGGNSPLSHALPFPPVPEPPSSLDGEWSCSQCTLINHSSYTHCSLCSHARSMTAAERQWTESLRECQICFTAVPQSMIMTLHSPCQHNYCYECCHNYLLSLMDSGRVLDIQCPHTDCHRPFVKSEILSVLSPHQYQKLKRFQQNAELIRDPRVRFCTNAKCSALLYGNSMAPRLVCHQCGNEQCFVCNIKWHHSLTCSEVQALVTSDADSGAIIDPRDEDIQFLQTMRAGVPGDSKGGLQFRQCHACRCWLEKVTGCSKMTCRCGANFCFECGSVNAQCGCTPRYHVFYPIQTVLSNWNGKGPAH